MIRVAVADDDVGFRSALVDVLEADPRFEVIAVASDGVEIVAAVAETRPDLVVLDVRMPAGGPDAVHAIQEVVAVPPMMVAVSAQTGSPHVTEMLEAGVVGYFAKGSLGRDVVGMLARCAGGQVVLAVPDGAEVLRRLRRTVV